MTTYAGLYGPEALIDGSGHPITSATIDVFTHGTTTHVSLYQDNARVTPLSNPVPNGVDGSTAGRGLDTFGNLSFYVDPGRYDLRIATGAGTRTVEIEIETDPAESAAAPVTSANSGTAYTITAPTHGESRLKLMLTGNPVFTLTGGTAGEVCAVQAQLIQDSTAGRTATWPGNIDWGVAGAPALDVAAGKLTRVYLTTDDGGASWQGALIGSGYTQPVAPSAPTSLAATGSTGQVALTWTQGAANGSTVTQNKIYRSTTTGTETLLATVSAATAYTDSTVTNGTTYFYKVSAVNALGESPLSTEATATPGTVTTAADDYNRADAIATSTTDGLIGQTTPTGAKLYSNRGSTRWSVSTNTAIANGAAGKVTINSGVHNCTVQADYKTDGTVTNGGLIFAWADASNFCAVISDSSGWFIQKTIAGVQSNVASGGTPLANTTYTVAVVLNGSSVIVKVGGVTVVTATIADASVLTATNHGYVSGSASNVWDNLLVTVP